MKIIWRVLCCLVLSLTLGLTLNVGISGVAWAEDETPNTAVEVAPAIEEAPVVKTSTVTGPDVVLIAKIDVNNTILRNYRQLPGFYPVLARQLVQNAPYDSVKDMLKIPGLTDAQKQLIQQNFPNFVAGSYEPGNNSLENRINKGYYG